MWPRSRRDGAVDEEPASRCGAGERWIRPWRGRSEFRETDSDG
ncbi:hypothetical protein M6B38_389810 [Iris pallida]|uniref:Uncharacterized protein n=1 Tax=Iris pallida TaxID=29817 RepID=A0AAX6G126_IRIPA|nr:hypothetical protein M6B38_389810 [Iris pallida]